MAFAPNRSRRALILLGVAVLALAAIGTVFTPSDRAVGPSRTMFGVVETVGAIASTRARRATQVIATVRLPNGDAVLANVRDRAPLRPGSRVMLRVYASGQGHEIVGEAEPF